ncbi:MAG: HNH endonuclease [Coriobacteriia bacterium]|nr:HNH endonuclease [Coriobacteriia bacterium]
MSPLRLLLSLRRTAKMLRAGYTPTRWSADGIDITLAGESWVCNGAGCFENPEDALACASRTELHSVEVWKNMYIGRRTLTVSSLGRIRDENGEEILTYEDAGGYHCLELKGVTDTDEGPRPYHVHRLVARAFCPGEALSDKTSVHHLNLNRYDNRAANLVILPKYAHKLIHSPEGEEGAYRKNEYDLIVSPRSEFRFAIKNLEKEWREIPGYDNLYWVNKQGLIINFEHRAITGTQEPGRWFVNLKNSAGAISRHAIDSLVAATWADHEQNHCDFLVEGKGHLAHKNGDLSDSCIDNLQWVRHLSQVEDSPNPNNRYSLIDSEWGEVKDEVCAG